METKKLNILCVPLDPVHDVGLRMIKNALDHRGHSTILLPPDMPMDEVVRKCVEHHFDFVLISRTLGYGVAELMAKFNDMLDSAGLHDKTKVVIGGKAVTPELATEIGFDKGFSTSDSIDAVIAYLEGREYIPQVDDIIHKRDIMAKYDFAWSNPIIEDLASGICDQILSWAENKTSPGIERADIKKLILNSNSEKEKSDLLNEYLKLSDPKIADFFTKGICLPGTRVLRDDELSVINKIPDSGKTRVIQHTKNQPLAILFTGSGCPLMDAIHNMIAAEWGINGSISICPSWVARTEGLLSGMISHEEDGTIPTLENLKFIRKHLRQNLFMQVRAHRGLNTAETALYTTAVGADFCKINPVYGSINAGTDPERLLLDAIHAIKTVSAAGIPFDIPANDELSGIPTYKSFAGMIVTAMLARKLGAKPILKPLFCFGPYTMINGQMDSNYIDYNAAKILALRAIINAPIWTGEPVGFMTHEDDRNQSASTTALHAMLAASAGADLFTFASTDESYGRGPITIPSRIDTCNSIRTTFRFFGDVGIEKTPKQKEYANWLQSEIIKALRKVHARGNFVQSIYEGDFGTPEEGGNPGRAGRGTVRIK